MNTLALILSAATILVGCGSSDSRTQDPTLQRSKEKNESTSNVGTIVYANGQFHLVRVKIDGVDYIANSQGGIVRVQP